MCVTADINVEYEVSAPPVGALEGAVGLDQLLAQAGAALDGRRWDEAADLYAAARAVAPQNRIAIVYNGWALREAGRLDEADALLSADIEQNPGQFWPQVHHAWVAMRRCDWTEADRRWEAVRRAFPGESIGYSEGASTLRNAKRLDEAERVLSDGLQHFPDDYSLQVHHGLAARDRQDWPEAERRWLRFTATFPDSPVGFVERALALRNIGRLAEAEALLGDAVKRFPGEAHLAHELARTATRSGQWRLAVDRWRAALERAPGDVRVRAELQIAEYHLSVSLAQVGPADEAAGVPSRHPVVSDGASSSAAELVGPQEILARFESLGDNCEFGFVQRYFGSEPLSLLRWGYVSWEDLFDGLTHAFDRIGDPENIDVFTFPHGDGELMLRSRQRFNGMHSHVNEASIEDIGLFKRQMGSRLDFLRRKLLRDLRTGEKILVRKGVARISDQDARALMKTLQGFGPNSLLCVRPPEPGFEAGRLDVLEPGLMIGYCNVVNAPAMQPLDYDGWLRLCTSAVQRVDTKVA